MLIYKGLVPFYGGDFFMKNNIVQCMLIVSVLLLSGCSELESKLNNKISEEFNKNISNDDDYAMYSDLSEKGNLDNQGFYHNSESDELSQYEPPVTPSGIHVTFATNQYLDVQYFYDANLTEPVDTDNCYLSTNDCIYYSPDITNQGTSRYKFDHFNIYQYNEDGERTEYKYATSDNMVIRIPENASTNHVRKKCLTINTVAYTSTF